MEYPDIFDNTPYGEISNVPVDRLPDIPTVSDVIDYLFRRKTQQLTEPDAVKSEQNQILQEPTETPIPGMEDLNEKVKNSLSSGDHTTGDNNININTEPKSPEEQQKIEKLSKQMNRVNAILGKQVQGKKWFFNGKYSTKSNPPPSGPDFNGGPGR